MTLTSSIRRWMIFLGALQIAVGCLIGFTPPAAVPWFRAIVMSHIEFTANGVMSIVLGLLAHELALGARALRAWFVTLQLGTWSNGLSGLIAAVLGASSAHLPTLNEKFPPPNGLDHPLVTGMLKFCGVMTMVGLLLTVWGLRPGRRVP